MVSVLYIEVNIFALSILFVILMSLQHRSDGHLIDSKLFFALLGLNAMNLIVDTIMFAVSGRSGIIARETIIILNAFRYITASIMLVLWNLYAHYQVYRDEEKLKKIIMPLAIPACISIILSVMSCFKAYLFYVDANNAYHRGKLFAIFAIMCIFYIIYAEAFIIKNKKQVTGKYFIPLAMFAVPPLIGGILQIIFYGISTTWTGATISALIISLNIQNDQLYTDHLTGLSNRRQLDRYLEECTRKSSRRKLLAGIMIDLDLFKRINDTWGHSVGDQAMVDAAEILKMSFRRSDLICRYGGDEFIVFFEIQKKSDLTEAINRLKANVKKYQEQNHTPYNIKFSIGYDIIDLGPGINVKQFLAHLDSLMYKNKKANKTGGRLLNI